MHRLYKRNKSFPQPRQLLLDDSNLGLGVGFLLAFLVDDGGRSTTHEAFVGKHYDLFSRNTITICKYSKTLSIFATAIQKQMDMDTVRIDIELPSCGYYSKEELTDLIYSYALSLVMPNTVTDRSVDDELKELNRRAAEMENDSSVCIPHEEVYERVMSRLHRYETHLA